MAYSSPVGTTYYISSTFAAAKTITVLTNASPPVSTATSHGYADDDELLLNLGWEDITDTVVRANQLTADTFELTGLNTLNTDIFASGAGTGSAYKVSSWIEIPQILSISPQGGGPRTIQVRPIKRRQGIILPNGFEPASITFTIGHDVSLTNWDTLMDISRTDTKVAYKAVKGNGAATYGYGYFSVSEQVSQQSDNADTVQATFSALGRLISYA